MRPRSVSQSGQGISLTVYPACQGCIADMVCPYWRDALSDLGYQGMGCQALRPPQEQVYLQSAELAFIEDPPDVQGQADPSGGAYPANSVVAFIRPTGADPEASAWMLTCTLPPKAHHACTTILNEYLVRNPA